MFVGVGQSRIASIFEVSTSIPLEETTIQEKPTCLLKMNTWEGLQIVAHGEEVSRLVSRESHVHPKFWIKQEYHQSRQQRIFQ